MSGDVDGDGDGDGDGDYVYDFHSIKKKVVIH